MLDEAALRRPEFAEDSEPITLGDGQVWCVPKPWVTLYPRVVNGKFESSRGEVSFGAEFDRLMEAANGDAPTLDDFLAVAVWMLNRNYSIPDDAYPELLRFRKDDEQSTEMFRAILAVARGQAPKPSPAGSESAA